MKKYRPSKRLSVNDLGSQHNSNTSLQKSQPQPRVTFQRVLVDTLQAFAQTILLFLIVSSLIGRFEVQQTSMEPNFHAGQRIMVSQLGDLLPDSLSRITYAAANRGNTALALKRGQVIVFYVSPQRQGDSLIKRLIGLPGDTIEIHSGLVFVNGAQLQEPYLQEVYTSCNEYCGRIKLGPDEYFLMGDNRPVSRDSRSFGPIHANQIVGRVILRFWPLDKLTLYG
jgi:signal peptidase I